jgi:hypothetical protein
MFDKILARLVAMLRENNLPYMIIGGQADLLYFYNAADTDDKNFLSTFRTLLKR